MTDQERIRRMGLRLREHILEGEPIGWVIRNAVNMTAANKPQNVAFLLDEVVSVRALLKKDAVAGVLDPTVDGYLECTMEVLVSLVGMLLKQGHQEAMRVFLEENPLVFRVLQCVNEHVTRVVADIARSLEITTEEAQKMIDCLMERELLSPCESDDEITFYITTAWGRKAIETFVPVLQP